MKSDKKCEYCKELMEKTIYASGSPVNVEKFGKGHTIIQCENYENCPKFNKK